MMRRFGRSLVVLDPPAYGRALLRRMISANLLMASCSPVIAIVMPLEAVTTALMVLTSNSD
jgi:hypothetical protein